MPSRVLNNVEALIIKFGKKISSDNKLLIAYWSIFDKIDMKDGKIVVDEFISKATNPTHILDAKKMLEAYEISKYDEEGWV